MSEFVVESGASTRARKRRRRASITLAVAALLLFFAFWYAWSYYKDAPSARATACPTTTTTKAAPVTVNVYNATKRDGLAADTATLLRTRGFAIGSVSNDPENKTIKGTAEVRYGKNGAKLANQVVAVVSKPAKVQDGRADATVDLVLGNGFKALVPVRPATPTTARDCL